MGNVTGRRGGTLRVTKLLRGASASDEAVSFSVTGVLLVHNDDADAVENVLNEGLFVDASPTLRDEYLELLQTDLAQEKERAKQEAQRLTAENQYLRQQLSQLTQQLGLPNNGWVR